MDHSSGQNKLEKNVLNLISFSHHHSCLVMNIWQNYAGMIILKTWAERKLATSQAKSASEINFTSLLILLS